MITSNNLSPQPIKQENLLEIKETFVSEEGQQRKIKLMSLNIWGGHIRQPLLNFIKSYQEVDVFCLQEVYNNASSKISRDNKKVSLNIFKELSMLLPYHKAFFKAVVGSSYGIGILLKKDISILGTGDIKIYNNPNYSGSGPTHSRYLQWLKFHSNNRIYSILNVHGLWNGKGKTDTQERLLQSQKIRNFMDTISTPKILCGDFNLRPDTESIKILEKGMENLIQIHNVNSTRTSLYQKSEKFADYIFTSPEITINTFEVLNDEISDHSPLLIDFY